MAGTNPDDSPALTVFKWPGMKPDVRLQVFDKTYHVHATLLRMHSAYFRKFMDSPDKDASLKFSTWTYEYVTVIDSEGTWSLEAKEKVEQPMLGSAPDESVPEARAFEKLLCAMYMKQYDISSAVDLEYLTQIADFYCALPIVSLSLSAILWRSFSFLIQMRFDGEASKILHMAYKLRQPYLFKDCIIWLAGKQDTDIAWASIEHPDILRLLKIKRFELQEKFTHLLLGIIDTEGYCLSDGRYMSPQQARDFRNHAATLANKHDVLTPFGSRVQFVSDLTGKALSTPTNCFLPAIVELLANNLILHSAIPFSYRETSFLCTTVDDDELPWDTSENDW